MKPLLVLLALPLLAACGNPMQVFQSEVEKMGYIAYQTPLQTAGTGTIVGGTPKTMSFVEATQTCFPDSIGTPDAPLRRLDPTALPIVNNTIQVSADLTLSFINFLGNSNSLFTINPGFSIVNTIEFSATNGQTETLDQMLVQKYYDTPEKDGGMTDLCRDYLDQFGFVIQALRADTLTFAFKGKDGGYLKLDAQAIKEILNINLDVEYSIDQDYLLTFNTPKYFGYQLGKLQKADDGFDLFRASSIKPVLDQYIFKSIALFNPSPTPTPQAQN